VIEAHLLLGRLPWVLPRWSWRGPTSQGQVSLLPPGPSGPWGLHSVESGNGRLTYLAETKRGSHPPVSILATLWAGSWQQARWRAVFCPVSHLITLEAGPGGVRCCPARVEVGGGSLRAAAKSWAFHWSQALSRSLNTLNAIFTRSPWGVWGPSSACLSFLWILGKDWKIKWELRIIGLGI
jgi:hypothetical protein